MIAYSYDRRARSDVPINILEFVRMMRPGDEVELFLVERQDTFYTLYFSDSSNLSLGIKSRSDSKSRARSDYRRIKDKYLKDVSMMGGSDDEGEAEITATRPDSEAKQHVGYFNSPIMRIDWGEGDELGSPQEDFLPYMQRQIKDWKGSSVSLSATRHEYWPEFHSMMQDAIQKKYGSSIALYRGLHGKSAMEVLKNPGKPIALRLYTSFADSLGGAKEYRGARDWWVVVKTVFRPKDIALAPVLLPGFIEPDILMPLAYDVQHVGDELVVGPRRKLQHYSIVMKTKKPLP